MFLVHYLKPRAKVLIFADIHKFIYAFFDKNNQKAKLR